MGHLARAFIFPERIVDDADALDRLALGTQKRGVITFECPLCRNRVRNDAANLEPVCTGPHPSLDEHPVTVMVRQPR